MIYVVRTTLYQIDGTTEKPIAGIESDDFEEIEDGVEEFLRAADAEADDIEEYLLCEVPELETDDEDEDGAIDVDAEEPEEESVP